MIADLKPFTECKASLQAWVGVVPQHWAVFRAANHLNPQSDCPRNSMRSEPVYGTRYSTADAQASCLVLCMTDTCGGG